MRRFYRVVKRKRNVRRILAGAFVLIAFIELGSHAFADSQDIAHFETLGFCGIQHESSLSIDNPAKQKQRNQSSSLLDEMTTHMVVLSALTLPRVSVSYWADDPVETVTHSLSGILATPFHPPKQA
jgi:hypothetical protein